ARRPLGAGRCRLGRDGDQRHARQLRPRGPRRLPPARRRGQVVVPADRGRAREVRAVSGSPSPPYSGARGWGGGGGLHPPPPPPPPPGGGFWRGAPPSPPPRAVASRRGRSCPAAASC